MSKIRSPLHHEIIPGPGTLIRWEDIEKRLEDCLSFAKSIHIDIVDGIFAPHSTWMDPSPFAKYAKKVQLEAHFMTDNPIQYIKPFANAGFVRFIGQIEKMPDPTAFVAEGQLWGEVGLALDGPTPLEDLKVDADDLDVVLLYVGQHAGSSGGVFVPERLEKIGKLREKDTLLPIEVDGGVNDENISALKDAGVTRFVSTGFLFNGNPEEQFHKLQKSIL
ncbi:MAG TPA: hypothetical protein VLB73_04660 [Patescibacteria group bacterium]|nr:hypothetical protein [Patescibacteria group bacterium]